LGEKYISMRQREKSFLKKVRSTAFLVVLLILPVSCFALTIEGFEGGTNGWGPAAGVAAGVSISASSVGVTEGLASIQVDNTGTGFAFSALQKNIFADTAAKAALTALDGAISIDVLAESVDVPAGWLSLGTVVYGDGGNESLAGVPVIIDGSSHTLTFALSEAQKDVISNSTSWVRIGFSTNSTSTRSFYVDAITVTGNPVLTPPPPSPAALRYNEWIETYPSAANKSFGSNVYNYAIGANPTDSFTTGHHPVHSCGENCEYIDYTHIARIDAEARGLVYTVETTDDLASGTWTTKGLTVVDVNQMAEDFTSVTSRLNTTNSKGFIRLKIASEFTWAGRDALDDFGGLKAMAFSEVEVPNNGFFRTTLQDGKWWLVTPQNNAYLSFGLNHFHSNYWINRGFSDNRVHWETEFDATAYTTQWRDAFYEHAGEVSAMVGANCYGYHNEENILLDRGPQLPYYRQYMPVKISSHMNAQTVDYVDVFAEEFVTHCSDTAALQVLPHVNDPMIIGFTMTDVPFVTEKRSLDNNRPTWAMVLRNLPASAPGKQAYVNTMQSRYANIDDFNIVYGSSFGNWTALKSAVGWRPTSDKNNTAEIEDQNAFNRVCFDKYYEVAEAAFRAVNPNHLFIGDKLQANMRYSDELQLMVEVAKDYVDIVMYQFFGHNDQYDGYQNNIQNDIAEWSDLPIMNGDGGFGFSGDPNMNALQRPTAADHEQRAQWFYEYAEVGFAHPSFVGWHICGVIDSWMSSGQDKPGIMDPFGNPHEPEVKALKNVSINLYNLKLKP